MVSAEQSQCAPWCVEGARHHRAYTLRADQNCWGPDHSVVLGLESGAPATHLSFEEQMKQDPPRITACAYLAVVRAAGRLSACVPTIG